MSAKHLVGELNHFFDFWIKLSRLLPEEIETLRFGNKNFVECFDAMRDFFKEIVTGMESGDFVLAADLLQYEVIPAIEALQQVIPRLKQRLLEINVQILEEEAPVR